MRLAFSISIVMCSPIFCVAQDYIEAVNWLHNNYTAQQIFTPDDKNLRLKNTIQNGRLIRTEYYNNGVIKLTCEIKQHEKNIDTIMVEDGFGDYNLLSTLGFIDLPNGLFIMNYSNGHVKKTGHVYDKEKFGVWLYYYPNGQLEKEENYNYAGRLDGAYRLYDKNGTIVCYGHYVAVEDTVQYEYYNIINDTTETYPMVKLESKKSGVWLYYNTSGNIIREEKY